MYKKTQLLAAIMVFGFATAALAGSSMDDVLAVNNQVQAAAQKGAGVWLKALIGWLPLALFFIVPVGIFTYHKQKQEQQNQGDQVKIAIWVLIGALVGAILGMGINMAIGVFLFGAPLCGVELMQVYWKEAVGLSQGGSFNCN